MTSTQGEPQALDTADVLLVPGGNIAIWPEVKLGRAYAHMMEIQQRIEEWEALRPIRSKATSVGDAEVWITLEVSVPPPLEALATMFGDAIHNLRSALDAVTWEMANFEGEHPMTEDAEKAVQFPLYDDPNKFVKWSERVGSIPSALLARLEAQQPYNRAAALAALGQVDTLLALHALDIVDKHRNSISAVAAVRDFSDTTMGIRGDTRKLVSVAQERVPMTNDSVLVKVTSTEPFELIEYSSGPISAHFDIPAMGGFAPLLDLLGMAAGKVRATLDSLYGEQPISKDFDTSVTMHIDAGKVTNTDTTPSENDQRN